MIGGEATRAALRLAVLLVLLSILAIPFQAPGSAESVVAIMALVVSLAFVAVVFVLARLGTSRLPRNDKHASKGYNVTGPAVNRPGRPQGGTHDRGR
jgi:peptidoglycan/LPS O-acetylase OafA/YrhL